jgi:hypothetical protein
VQTKVRAVRFFVAVIVMVSLLVALVASTKGSLTRGKYRVNTIRALFFGTLDIQAFSRGARSRRRVR